MTLKEEVADQIKALKGLKEMAALYGFDISKPATTAKEAVQWLYFGYLGAIKTQNGAAMSIGRVSTFLDIYINRDLEAGLITESQAQELVDHFVMKARMVRFARIESYNNLFSGDPVWATLEVGGLGQDGRSLVTKNDFRFLHTLENMGPAPEPNMTVLYSKRLPENFRRYAAKISIDTSSIQYENDDVMRPVWGDDYSICCCVSATQTGKEMQFFGARANLAQRRRFDTRRQLTSRQTSVQLYMLRQVRPHAPCGQSHAFQREKNCHASSQAVRYAQQEKTFHPPCLQPCLSAIRAT